MKILSVIWTLCPTAAIVVARIGQYLGWFLDVFAQGRGRREAREVAIRRFQRAASEVG